MNIAHCSDLHFGACEPELVEGLIVALNGLDPDLVIASGDFTMAGRHSEYRGAADCLRRIRAPIVATPGNHDIPAYNLLERFAAPLARYQRYIAPLTLSELRHGDLAMLTVNTARPWMTAFNWSHGEISDRQVRDADRFFAQSRGFPRRALVVHHPFFVPETLPQFRPIRNGRAMLEVLARHEVQAVFAGHLHQQFAVNREVQIEADRREVLVIQVGTATSTRRRDQPNGFHMVRWTGQGIVVEEHVWDGERFSLKEAHVGGEDAVTAHAPDTRATDAAADEVSDQRARENGTSVNLRALAHGERSK